MSRFAFKDHHRETRLFNWRLLIVGIFCLILLGSLMLRLSYLQIIDHDRYKTLSKNNQLAFVPIAPTRGLIYDRHGTLIAENIPTFNLEIIPKRVSNMNDTLTALSKIIPISDEDKTSFKKQLKQQRRVESIPLRLHLTEQEVARFAVNQQRFPGVVVKARLLRNYPQGKTFAHVLGYVGRLNAKDLQRVDPNNYSASQFIGKVGLEKSLESRLHGQAGYQQIETDATGRTVRTLSRTAPIAGKNIKLTLDSHLQAYANKLLRGYRGAIVALNPNNGDILALASSPTYDPNLFSQGISTKDFKRLQQSRNQPLYNRAVRGQYPPGSTVKPFVSLMSLASRVITPKQWVYDQGWFKLPNAQHIYHDMLRSGHGWIRLRRALIVSCDVFFYMLANKLGIKRLDWILSQFGFGDKTGIELTEERPGILPSPTWKKSHKQRRWYTGDTIITGIGQGFMLATPLQLAVAIGTVAEKGVRAQPHLIQTKTETIKTTLNLPANTWAWSFVRNALAKVTTLGTGRRFGNTPYTVAGKTGTAQVISMNNKQYAKQELPERLRDHSWFIAYAPTKKPQIALAVIVENNMEGRSVTVTRQFLDYYFKHVKKEKASYG